MNRNRIATLAVVGLLLTAGCLDLTTTIEVSEDGDIDSVDVEIEMDAMLYEQLERTAHEEGHESVEAMLEADLMNDTDQGQYGAVSSSVTELDNGDYRIELTATDVDPAGLDDIEVTAEGDTVSFESDTNITEDSGVGEGGDIEEFEGQISLTYVLVMPGEIRDTNADTVSDDGTTATWDLVTTDTETLYAESVTAADETETDEASETDDEREADDGTPGFGAIVGIVGLLVALGVRLRTL